MTLKEFIEVGKQHGRANLHLKVPGFTTFYARYGRRMLSNQGFFDVLDIATIEVEEELRGKGIFTKLIKQLREDYPDMPLYVENATPRLQRHLKKLGFTPHEFSPGSYYLLGGISL